MLANKKYSQQKYIKLFTVTKCTTIINQMKKIFKKLIHRNIFFTDQNKKK